MTKYIKYVIVFSPAFVYFFLILKYTVNVPAMDDYDAILRFLSNFRTTPGVDKYYLLFHQQNEHRIVASKIFYVLYHKIFGIINIKHIIIIGNLQLLGSFIIFLYFIKKCLPANWFLVAFGASLCFFDISNWQNMYHAMSSIQNYGIVLLFLSSLLFFSFDKKKYIAPAIFLQILCIYSSGNGLIGAVFLVAFNIFNRNKFAAISSIIAFLIFAPLYFYQYNTPPPPIGRMVTDVDKVTIYVFHMLSSHVYLQHETLPILVGIMLFVGFFFIAPLNKKLQFTKGTLPFVSLAGFFMATIVVTALFRSNLCDYTPSRYLVYPHVLMAVFLVFLMLKFREEKHQQWIGMISCLALLSIYIFNFQDGKSDLVLEEKKLKDSKYYYPSEESAKEAATRACELEIYCIERHR